MSVKYEIFYIKESYYAYFQVHNFYFGLLLD